MNKIVVRSEYKKYGIYENRVKGAVRSALVFFKKDKVFVEVNLIGSKEMRRLNRKFRDKNKVTNILSFSEPKIFPHPETCFRPLGEIYLAPDWIAEKGEDLAALAVHGTLHLLGFSHSREGDRMRMEKVEQKICQHG